MGERSRVKLDGRREDGDIESDQDCDMLSALAM